MPDRMVSAMLEQLHRFEHGEWRPEAVTVVSEALVRIHVNGIELTRLMATPEELDLLALGFLRAEGIISAMGDVRLLHVCPTGSCVEVWLKDPAFVRPTTPTITSGCGGGVTFADLTAVTQPIESMMVAEAGQLSHLMAKLMAIRTVRGSHLSGLARGDQLVATAGDVGRHNTIDKVWGRCLREGIATEDCILLSTGRISSEMLSKAARMQAPLVVSRTSPTSLSIALAAAWNITLVGYVRHNSLNIYSAPHRVVGFEEKTRDANS